MDAAYRGRCAQDIRQRLGLDREVVRHPGNRSAGRLVDGQLGLFEPLPSGFVLLSRRRVIERNISWNDRPRRLIQDHDRRIDVSAAWIWLTEARLLLRRIADTPVAAVA